MLGLIADDLTGANDAAVQFARCGWSTLLVLERSAMARPLAHRSLGEGGSVVAVTTDARALDNAAAEKATADAVAQLVDAGIDRIFLKIDSTMRGSVPGQIAGALSAWRPAGSAASAVVCPAYPQMGRTVVENRVLIDGGLLELSPIGRDPVTPVRTSDLAVLIPGSEKRGREPFSTGNSEKGSRPLFSITTVDASSDEDLAVLATAIVAAGAPVIPVGSAGLAKAMASAWSAVPKRAADERRHRVPPDPRILVQVTSLNPVSLAQVARLAEKFPDVLVLTGEARSASAAVHEHLRSGRWDVLGLVGGDGARAAVARLGASAIRIVDTLLEGVPLGVIIGGAADGMPVFTKAGGFGNEDALVRIVEGLKT